MSEVIGVILHHVGHVALLFLSICLWYSLEQFMGRVRRWKELQDKADGKMIEFLEQSNSDMEKLEDRMSKIEKGKG